MLGRSTIADRACLQKGLYDLYAVVAVGAAGAVTLQFWNYPLFGGGVNARTYTAASTTGGSTGVPQRYQQGTDGIFSVTRTGAGLWTFKLQDNFQRLLELQVMPSLAGGTSAIVGCGVNSTLTTTASMAAVGGSVIAIALLSATATALDPASGETIVVHFGLQAATEP